MGTDQPPDTSAVFELLTDARRRYVLHHLRQSREPVDVDDLAEAIVEWEADSEPQVELDDVRAALYHVHLPKLDDASIVDFERGPGTVSLCGNLEVVEPYLEMTDDD
ncbi:hypothetical protein VB773_21975 [Haloarculaceae archaeon H-GB2-1]|nr:hypothetical protein [Haloarculaceae archaeon H-GB1-1]MEA5389575.1 hypothetical protein [Haloarculaceae archaeon H-GB11]MEA5409972.1 hypothetical protein [Haloarculaceae archaeon H-GB2-1]